MVCSLALRVCVCVRSYAWLELHNLALRVIDYVLDIARAMQGDFDKNKVHDLTLHVIKEFPYLIY